VAEWLAPSLRPEVADESRQIRPFYESIGFASQFTADEVDAEDREAMVQTAISNPLLGNDPVGPSVDDLREIVARACQS
jgi:alcohol dehydrogenase class IV